MDCSEGLTEIDRAYAAGIIDGEGSICIGKVLLQPHHRSYKKQKSPVYSLVVQVRMTDSFAVEFLHSKFGGRLHLRKPFLRGKLPVYDWKIYSRNALGFLQLIYPYLKCKKAQARVIFSFMAIEKLWGVSEKERIRINHKKECHYRMLQRYNQRTITIVEMEGVNAGYAS